VKCRIRMETRKLVLFWILITINVGAILDLCFLFSLKEKVIPDNILKVNPQWEVAGYGGEIKNSGVFKFETKEKILRIRYYTNIYALGGDYECIEAKFINSDTSIIIDTHGGHSELGYKKYTDEKPIQPWLDVPTNIVLKNKLINSNVQFTVSFDVKFPVGAYNDTYSWGNSKISKDFELFLISTKDFNKISDSVFYKEYGISSIVITTVIIIFSLILILFRKKSLDAFFSHSDSFLQVIALLLFLIVLWRIAEFIFNGEYVHLF